MKLFTVNLHFSVAEGESVDRVISGAFSADDPDISRAFYDIFSIMVNDEPQEVACAASWEEAITDAIKPLARVATLIERHCNLAATKPQNIKLRGEYGELTVNFTASGTLAHGSARVVCYPGGPGTGVWRNKSIYAQTWEEVNHWVEKEVMPAWDFLLKYWAQKRQDAERRAENFF